MILNFYTYYAKTRIVLLSAFTALKRNKVRSLLTSIGIIIGVSSVIIMTGLANSAKITVKQKIVSYGSNAMSIGWSLKPLKERNFFDIKNISPSIQFATPYCDMDEMPVRVGRTTERVRIIGVNNDYFDMRGWSLIEGRYFNESDLSSGLNVAVIGLSVQNIFFGGYSSVGNLLYINNNPYQIIGILEETGTSLSGKDGDNVLLIPYTTAFQRFIGKREMAGINVSTYDDAMIDDVKKIITGYLRADHSLPSEQKDDFAIVTSRDKMKVANTISGILTYLLAGVASISLIVGGIGIMNIMLVSVTERTREIGIRRAVGANQNDILIQFLAEAITLSIMGGIIGIVLGLGIYYVIIKILGWQVIISAASILVSFLFAAGTGIFFGFYPAKKASDLKPIDALRYE